jgi:hypothetical protein
MKLTRCERFASPDFSRDVSVATFMLSASPLQQYPHASQNSVFLYLDSIASNGNFASIEMLRQMQVHITGQRQNWPLIVQKTLRPGDFAASREARSIRASLLIVEFMQPESQCNR